MTDLLAATPAFPVEDLDRAVRFYADHLDFGMIAQDAGFALVQREPITLHLWLSSDESWKTRSASAPIVSGAESFLAGTASCRIQVTGIDALYRRCQTSGIVHPNGPLAEAEYGAREFAVLDPDGNLITFFEMNG